MTENAKILGFADALPQDIADYELKDPAERSFALCKSACTVLSEKIGVAFQSLNQQVTDFISIESASVSRGQGYGHAIRLANRLNLTSVQSHLVDTGGASVASSLALGAQIIAANPYAGVLMVAGDAPRSALTSISDLKLINETTLHPEYEYSRGATLLGLYALLARREMHDSNIQPDDFLEINRYFRNCAKENSRAIHQTGELRDKELRRPVASPYYPPMVAVVSDQGCAWFMAGEKHSLYSKPGVYVRGWSQSIHSEYFCFKDPGQSPALNSGVQALQMAGFEPGMLEYAWLYDCFTGMLARQAAAVFNEPYARQVEQLKTGHVVWGDSTIPVNQQGGLMNVQAAMSISGACGMVDISTQLGFYANTNSTAKKKSAILLGNGGVDSVSSAVVIAHEPGPQRLVSRPQILKLNDPSVTAFKAPLYSYTKVLIAPGSAHRPPYILGQVKNSDGHTWTGLLKTKSGEVPEEVDLAIDQSIIEVSVSGDCGFLT